MRWRPAFVVLGQRGRRREVAVNQLPPEDSPYITSKSPPEYHMNPWPETYIPQADYPGTMKPGATPENSPVADLDWHDVTETFDDFAFFEIPFHVRYPANNPHLDGPYDRLDFAGRFLSDEEINRRVKLGKDDADDDPPIVMDTAAPKPLAVEEEGPVVARNPVFDDSASSLLDAALGLDDDDEDGAALEKEEAANLRQVAGAPDPEEEDNKSGGPAFSDPTAYLVD